MFGSVCYTGQHKNSNTSVVVSTFSTSRRLRYMTFMGSKTINCPSFCLSPALKWKCHDFSFWFCIIGSWKKRLGFVLHIFLLRRPLTMLRLSWLSRIHLNPAYRLTEMRETQLIFVRRPLFLLFSREELSTTAYKDIRLLRTPAHYRHPLLLETNSSFCPDGN